MLKQKFLVQFGSNISLKILGAISGIVVARVAGPEVLGTIAYATAYVSIFGFITGLFGTSHIKLISEGRNLGKCMSTYTRLQIFSTGLFLLVVLCWFCFQKFVLHHVFESKVQEQVILITLVAIVFTKLVDFNNSSFTGQLKQTKANLPHLIRGFLFQVGKIAVVLLGFRALGLTTWNLITAVIVLPITYRLFRTLPWEKYNKQLAKKYIKIAMPILLIVILSSLMGNIDRLLLQEYTSSTELGYYSIAYSLGGMILIIRGSTGTVFFPLFSSLIAKSDWKTINYKIRLFESFITTFIFPFICLAALISEPLIITILGNTYQHSVLPFAILIFASYFSIVGMPYGNIITGMGRFYLSLGLNFAKFLFYIVILIYLISPQFLGLGAIGVALCVLFVNLIYNSLFFIVSRKIGNIETHYKNYIRYLIIIIISISILVSCPYISEISDFWWLILILPYLLLIYGTLFITGLLKRSQVAELLILLNLKITAKYIKNEIKEK